MSQRVVNILYSSLSGEIIGGGQFSLLLLLKNLNRTRFRPFLVCPTPGEVIDRAGKMGVETVVIPMPPLTRISVKSIVRLTRYIKSRNIDLVHVDSPREAFYIGLATVCLRKPMIWHIRTSERHNRIFDHLLFRMARRVIPVSHAAAERFQGFRHTDKIAVIENGIDVADFALGHASTQIRGEFAPDNEILVGTVSQLIPSKGLETFLQAAALACRQSNRKIRLLIVGRGRDEYVATLKRRASELGIEDRVVFTGFRRDIPEIISALDIFVLATNFAEGLSRAILEAMAGAKPVVATSMGGNPELVENGYNGILAPSGDAQAFASAIIKLVENKEQRLMMGANGRERVKAKFDLATNIRNIEQIYEESIQ